MTKPMLLLSVLVLACSNWRPTAYAVWRPFFQTPAGIQSEPWEDCVQRVRNIAFSHPDVPDLSDEELSCVMHELMTKCAIREALARVAAGSGEPVDLASYTAEMNRRAKKFCGSDGGGTPLAQRVRDSVPYEQLIGETAQGEQLACPPEGTP